MGTITLLRMSLIFCLGFLAVILRHLAEAGVSVNVASGFYHDHLFVQDGEEELVMGLLRELSQSVTESSEEEEEEGSKRKEKKLKACEKSQDLDTKMESSDYEKETEEVKNNHDVVVVCSYSDDDHND